MALVLPVSAEPRDPGHSARSRRRHRSGPSPPTATLDRVGSVGSLVAAAAAHSGVELGARESPLERFLQTGSPPANRTSSKGQESGKWDYVDDWTDGHAASPTNYQDGTKEGLNGRVGGPPPRLVPVSGKLEKNMEKTVLRPTAFKPVVPKSRTPMRYLSPRHGASGPDGQSNLNLLSPAHRELSPSGSEKRSSYSAGRNGGGSSSHSCSLSDSGRNSLSSLPPYGGLASGEVVAAGHLEATKSAPSVSVHGHSNSDSGRSSSSKSSGSISGRGQPLSECGSGGRSPGPVEGYEGVVRDLEDKLREREEELQHLRENLDENEAAICQVYEEKQKRFELELEELRQSCATRMQTASQKAQRAQQVLQMQVHQLQQEKKKLQEDFGQLLKEREQLEERCTSYEHEKIQLGPRLEESKWEVCQKSGEISLLKQQLKEVQGELAQRVGEIVSLRGQLRETRGELTNTQALLQEASAAARTRTMELEVCENELQRRKSEAELLREKAARLEGELARLQDTLAAQGPGSRQCQVFQEDQDGEQSLSERLRAELALERQRAEQQAGGFEEERMVWQEEKDKVVRYQKELQHNYVNMYRRNHELEQMLRELSQELENRDDDEGSGNEIIFDDVAATEI
ncbi:leucine zipper putative tumor suppressor 2 homolog [Dunckerocampus dactyliophorus]|uniref:leucine zipper putative tumor suppressor 2 homolog n=1 Tax=Dunckerocampus dactyliophorus TaxID=161453 RepID=UPI002405918E|nr:leucine zipper putative tumor suppressor 2 homolog [Dunckerocampus dactyliophorus]XP_054609934.1 leucine zipper putative tumor suppressor 2 homolog [Dunckerocampus dactyliophorus]